MGVQVHTPGALLVMVLRVIPVGKVSVKVGIDDTKAVADWLVACVLAYT